MADGADNLAMVQARLLDGLARLDQRIGAEAAGIKFDLRNLIVGLDAMLGTQEVFKEQFSAILQAVYQEPAAAEHSLAEELGKLRGAFEKQAVLLAELPGKIKHAIIEAMEGDNDD